jgi:hypothetical protein
MRRVVAERHPGALAGGLGARPFVWVLADGQDRVIRSATGRDGLRRNGVTWGAAMRMLPGMPPSASEGDMLQLGRLAAGADTVSVVWVRLAAGLPGR